MALSNFEIDTTFTNVKTHQSVYSDGTNIWTTNHGSIANESGLYKYDISGTLLTSHDNATNDITGAESNIVQMNGMDLKNGKLYIGAMNYPQGSDWPVGDHQSGHLYQNSYITRWDAATLAYEAKWPVGDSTVNGANSVAKWTEGCAWHEGSQRWFVIFHGDPVVEEYSEDENGDFVFEARHTLPSVFNDDAEYNAHGFEDITFSGDTCWMNRHAATYDPYIYAFRWTGSGFTYLAKYPQSLLGSLYTQGVNIQPGTNIMWWTERTSVGSPAGAIGNISKVYVRGIDIEDITNGVLTASDTGVRFTNANGVIISK